MESRANATEKSNFFICKMGLEGKVNRFFHAKVSKRRKSDEWKDAALSYLGNKFIKKGRP
jgi:hypothetical protein